ncbi:MAG: CPBP family intramembrane metalloprotease, partial [Calditrichaceae bacterium]
MKINHSPKSFPGFWQSVLLLVIIVLIQVALAIPIVIYDYINNTHVVNHPATLGFINLISIGIVILIGKKFTDKSYPEVLPLKKVSAVQFITVLLTAVGLSIVLSDLDNLIRMLIPMPDFIEKIFSDLLSNESGLLISLFTIVLVAAFSEEFLFRGLFFQGYEERYGSTKAIFYTALMFGLFHMNPWQFSGAVILGAVYAWWFVLTRNLWLCVLGHGFNNLISVLGVRYFPVQGFSSDVSSEPRFQPFWFLLIGIVLSAA